jgi:ABC-2 type transport system ATP-binding protein
LDGDTANIRRNVGIIFQRPSLDLNLSAEENIRLHACMYGLYGYRPFFSWMPKAYKERVIELAEIVDIKDSLSKPLRTFSGGMQRKLEIIRSLIHEPKVLFLDEPTQGLDAVARRSLWEYLNRTRKENGTTIFLTTHYIDEADGVDHVCMVKHGKILVSGTPEDLKNALLKKELHLDADNRAGLLSELRTLGAEPTVGERYVIVPFKENTPMSILSRLQTPLNVVKIIEPSLEDAYVALAVEKEVA